MLHHLSWEKRVYILRDAEQDLIYTGAELKKHIGDRGGIFISGYKQEDVINKLTRMKNSWEPMQIRRGACAHLTELKANRGAALNLSGTTKSLGDSALVLYQ